MAGLSNVVSRHNTPSVAHFLAKMVQAEKKNGEQVAIIVCLLIVAVPVLCIDGGEVGGGGGLCLHFIVTFCTARGK